VNNIDTFEHMVQHDNFSSLKPTSLILMDCIRKKQLLSLSQEWPGPTLQLAIRVIYQSATEKKDRCPQINSGNSFIHHAN